MSLDDWIFWFWGAESRKKSLLIESLSLIFFWFFGEVSEQSDQVDPIFFLLRIVNNDKKEGWELEKLICSLNWLCMLQINS